MPRKKKEKNPYSAMIEAQRIIIEAAKNPVFNNKNAVIMKILRNIRLNASIGKHQLETVVEYEATADEKILISTSTGIRQATSEERYKALLRKTDPQNIVFGKDD